MRVHGRPTRSNYKTLKSEASALASKVEDITYSWSKNATDNYGLLGNILGVDEYNELTNIDTYAIPIEPASYNPSITNATLTHKHKQKEKNGISFKHCGSSKRVSSGTLLTTYMMHFTSSTTPS
jgi:hypothetical protein